MDSNTPIWISAAATTFASMVALFGPTIRSRWARPRITLHSPSDPFLRHDELILVAESEPEEVSEQTRMQFATLEVTNHGRSQLEDLEAVLTAHQHIGPAPSQPGDEDQEETIPAFDVPVLSRGLLQFELADARHPRVTIPSGATRVLRLVFLAIDEIARDELGRRGEDLPGRGASVVGGFALWPLAGADRMTWLLDNDTTAIEITLSARNAKASTWRGAIRVWYWSGIKDEDYDLSGIKLEWADGLRRVRHTRPPTPRRAWIISHTPWALWRQRQFEREMRRIDAVRDAATGGRDSSSA